MVLSKMINPSNVPIIVITLFIPLSPIRSACQEQVASTTAATGKSPPQSMHVIGFVGATAKRLMGFFFAHHRQTALKNNKRKGLLPE